MPSVLAYHRPTTVAEASALLAGPDRVALAGGTSLVPEARVVREQGVEVVDIQGLDLAGIENGDAGRVTVGAMVRLADVVGDGRIPDVVREAAHRELPSALRNQATVGGAAALAHPDSLLFAALLVHDARLLLYDVPARALAEGIRPGGSELILGVDIDAGGGGALAVTGRTPADDAIVGAVARRADRTVRLALTGVAETPVEVDPGDPTASLAPPDDFRGSSTYRRHLAAVLSERVLGAIA